MQVCKDQLSTADKMNFENGTGQNLIKTCPEVIQNSALVGYAMLLPPILHFLHFSLLENKS